MSSKKRAFGNDPGRKNANNSDSSDGELYQDAYTGNEEIQVDFEGRNPIDSDFHGIKQLLLQLFLKAHIDVSELTDLIIGQNYIGSVVKQSDDGDAEDEDDEMSDVNDVYGITTVVGLMNKQNVDCVQQLRTLLVELADKNASESTNKLIRDILSDESKPAGLLICERFVNIPAQISVPLLENLHKEIQKAANKKMPFNFTYYILICKLYKPDKTNCTDDDIIWSNPEEEIVAPEAIASFEFSVKNEADSAVDGHWLEGDSTMIPYRRILLLEAEKLPSIIQNIKKHVT